MNNDIRNLSKWLNEEQETPIDRQALARVLAMAEQPAQGCEFCSHPLYAGTKCKNCGREQPAQQEPVAWGWAIMHSDGTYVWIRPRIADFFGSIQEREPYTSEDAKHADREWAGLAPHTIVTLYTTPQAQPAQPSKPWVGLTEEEIEEVWKRIQANDFHDCVQPFALAIEAKLKEKNT